ncbi:MAG: EutN/CcmL family microcompartment protein [Propionibacteriaceae bacterium]|jgi:ethanolamine utilization protein EutN|nr:EutN/CcmL family microcompartment protein [Propionibacteriaceae bacterium]
MFLAKVRGTVVSTQKDERLVGTKLLITQRIDVEGKYLERPNVSVDTVGAGVGETVIIAEGSSARVASGRTDSPIDSAIVGIVDTTEIEA